MAKKPPGLGLAELEVELKNSTAVTNLLQCAQCRTMSSPSCALLCCSLEILWQWSSLGAKNLQCLVNFGHLGLVMQKVERQARVSDSLSSKSFDLAGEVRSIATDLTLIWL
jgi:hypothetical protein